MDISFHGANCIKIATKLTTVVVDDNLEVLGAKSVTGNEDVAVCTQERIKVANGRLMLDSAGEYELADLTVIGIQTRAYTDSEDEQTATIFKFVSGTNQVVVLGHVQPKLTDKVLEAIGVVDVLLIPVGGRGYTLDAEDAANVIKLIEPKVIVPTHYEQKGFNFEVPQSTLEEFTAKLGVTAPAPVRNIKLKGEVESGIVILES